MKSCASCANKRCGNAGSDQGVPCGNWTGHAKKLTGRQVLNRITKRFLDSGTLTVAQVEIINQLSKEI